MDKKKYAPQLFKTLDVDRKNYTIRFVMSTPDVDRHGESINQDGWDFTNYMKNPVVLWGHDQSVPAIGKILSLENTNGNTEGVVQFAYKQNPLAKMLFELYADEFMTAGSVGFLNLDSYYDEKREVVVLAKNELYEYSLVNVPANALALARKKGIDVSPLENIQAIEKRAALEKAGILSAKEVETPEAKALTTEDVPQAPEDEKPEDGVTKALETLMASGAQVIQDSIKQLTESVDTEPVKETKEADKKEMVEPTPVPQGREKNVHSVHEINRVIRSMIKASR